MEKIFNKIEKQESFVDLSNLSYEFCNDNLISDHYNKKISELEDKERWIEENRQYLIENKDEVNNAVELGVIANDNPETIWQFQVDKFSNGKEGVIEIKKEIEKRLDEIKNCVIEKLVKFLPEWKADKLNIIFTMNDKADFCVDRNEIIVDLGRLLNSDDFIDEVINGIAHEVFHIWMGEKNNWSDSNQENESDENLKSQIIFRTVDEGLAVLIGGQSLQKHHERQGRNYEEYIVESFDIFQKFLNENKKENLEEVKEEEFKDMGHFYVAGNEMAKIVLREIGIKEFKILIKECRADPMKMVDKYNKIKI